MELEAKRRYNRSAKGRAAARRYNKSEKGRVRRRRYNQRFQRLKAQRERNQVRRERAVHQEILTLGGVT
jgi:hypothetical protein